MSEDFKTKERCAKRAARKTAEFKQKELELQRKSKKKARLDPYILEKERVTKEEWRSNTRNKKIENTLDSKRKAFKRSSQWFCTKEKLSAMSRKYGSDIDVCIYLFHKSISVGPVYICSCCHQTWFKVMIITNLEQKQKSA